MAKQVWAKIVGLNAFCRLNRRHIAPRMQLIEEFINSSFYDPGMLQLVRYAGPSGEQFVIDEPLIHYFLHLPTRNNTV